jgi:hypothetical protein
MLDGISDTNSPFGFAPCGPPSWKRTLTLPSYALEILALSGPFSNPQNLTRLSPQKLVLKTPNQRLPADA